MIRLLMIVGLLTPIIIYGQEVVPPSVEENMENLAETSGEEMKDDSWNQAMENFSRHRIDLNHCDANELTELHLLNALQIQIFLRYREALGPMLEIHELQAVPGWNLETIRRIIPFVTVDENQRTIPFLKRFRHGESRLSYRVSASLENLSANANSGYYFLGDPIASNLRYKYQFRNLVQYGFTADKDAGEKFGFVQGQSGFDFYSIHFFARSLGNLKSIAIGDYTINMGQGLVMWQGLAMGFGSDITLVEKQSEILRPYTSSGEFNFQRGLAGSFKINNWEITGFLSLRSVDGNQVYDSASQIVRISSIIESGYHRTYGELQDKASLAIFSSGANLTYSRRSFKIGINTIEYSFSKSIEKADQPYNLYSFRGKNGLNFSMNYEFTLRNVHMFGEWAMDQNLHRAFLHGILMGLGQTLDFSLVLRDLARDYQALYGYPLGESSSGNNENGVFAGFGLRMGSKFKLTISEDLYRFPWLRYGINEPMYGSAYMANLVWHPDKTTELNLNTRFAKKGSNEPEMNIGGIPPVDESRKLNVRFQMNCQLSRELSLKSRLEFLKLLGMGEGSQNAFLAYLDFFYKPFIRKYSLNLRLESFEADSYDSRVYAYENDVLYYNYIPFFYGRGLRYYFNLKLKPAKRLGLWVKWSQTYFLKAEEIQNTLSEGIPKHKSDFRVLCTLNF